MNIEQFKISGDFSGDVPSQYSKLSLLFPVPNIVLNEKHEQKVVLSIPISNTPINLNRHLSHM